MNDYDLRQARDTAEAMIEALQEISEAKGVFSRDPVEHAKNVIRDMQARAIDVLIKHGITPRGKPIEWCL